MLKNGILGSFLILQLSLISTICAQNNQSKADSLKALYKSGDFDMVEMEILDEIAQYESNLDTTLVYATLLLKEASKDSSYRYLINGLSHTGNVYQRKGDAIRAIDFYYKAMQLAQKNGNSEKAMALMISIADTYAVIGNTENFEKYYEQAIELIRKSDDSLSLARALLNSGEEYFYGDDLEHAMKNYKESGEIFRRLNHQSGIAYTLGNEGMVYAAQGRDELAMENINKAISILEARKDYYAISVYLTTMADIYAKKNDFAPAFKYANRSLQLAEENSLKEQIRDANLKLAELYELSNEKARAYDYYKNHIAYRDSITNLETVEQLANLTTAFEVSQKQGEIDILSEKQKNQKIVVLASMGMIFLIGILTFVLYRRNNFIRKTNLIIEKEKNRADHLLKNILPEGTAKELMDFGKVKSKKFETVSVLFADFKGFTLHAEHLSPEDLVKSVDFYFSKFDDIIEKYGIEKIKTLGDCYMCACGLPYPLEKHAQKLILAAKDFLDFVASAKEINPENTTRFDLRVGISSGTVVAGVVGKKKFAYDIWGDTVNIAARMESSSEIDKINISEDTFQLVKSDFNCTYRGEILVKNKGLMKMYFVNGLKSEKEADFQNKMQKTTSFSSESV